MKLVIIYDALYLSAIAQEMPTSKHEHVNEYILSKLSDDILHSELFGFFPSSWRNPTILKRHFSDMATIFKMLNTHLMIQVNICKITKQEAVSNLMEVIN